MEKCPFKPGETVVYTPSVRGHGQGVMTSYNALEPEKRYVVDRISQDAYVVLQGFEHEPAGGIYWTEFSKVDDSERSVSKNAKDV